MSRDLGSDNISTPNLIADSMLGRLAKWLRLFGLDVLYFNVIEDKELIALALKDKRIVLTRNTRLVMRKEFSRGLIGYILIHSENYKHQLQQVLSNLKSGQVLENQPRCNLCNTSLMIIEKIKAKNQVPNYVFQTQSIFRQCPSCSRIYWQGTHWKNIAIVKKEISKEKPVTAASSEINDGNIKKSKNKSDYYNKF